MNGGLFTGTTHSLSLGQSLICCRDIHPGNVLVTTRIDQTMPDSGVSTPPVVLLSDLGESQFMSDHGFGRSAYGNARYWAPEVWSAHEYSPASDVYAMGRLIADVVAAYWKVALNGASTSRWFIPEAILMAIIDCANPFPQRRPTASEIHQSVVGIRNSSSHNDLKLLPIDIESFESIFQGGNERIRISSGQTPMSSIISSI
jgi:serine/threonine protein kinase